MNQPAPLSCQETFRRLDDFIDRELDPHEMKLVQDHLEQCVVCAREFGFEETLIDELRAKIARLEVSPDLVKKISIRLRGASQPDD